MKFKFKIQKYQTDCVNSICDVFSGQPYQDKVKYVMDMGKTNKAIQTRIYEKAEQHGNDYNVIGFENNKILLDDKQLLENIQNVQISNNINQSITLSKDLGRVHLDVEMETGTGKTYCYIKTMFELSKRYGWNKFIVIVPSIAIREGVKKSLEITSEHFMNSYHKKTRFFIYNSKNLHKIDDFSSNSGINVMIINAQAFNRTGKDQRKIYDKQDTFQSRRPIDVIKANNPILILDEPQKLSGKKTLKSMEKFNSLFTIGFSATHKNEHNMIYVLDALEAYNKKLVKKIKVKGFELKNLRGTDGYLYLSSIILSNHKPPRAKLEFEICYKNSINREERILSEGDNLYDLSSGKGMPPLEEYKNDYVISEINAIENYVRFMNGITIKIGELHGEVNELNKRRIQIRETIRSHFETEKRNFDSHIKTLSLFFIDKVSNYRDYNENGEEIDGEYAKIFEEEYISILNEYKNLMDTPYQKYLEKYCTDPKIVHNGYFSVDNKGHITNTTGKTVEDESAYDLIMKDKERLLSFSEPTRFIFSHSALSEGWDNPNVFQICTLKKSDSNTRKRQEVGRGMRLCVNQNGDRMDSTVSDIDFHEVNKLTVIASNSYFDFVKDLQADIEDVIYKGRPKIVEKSYFEGKTIKDSDGNSIKINKHLASIIYKYLIKSDYIDEDDKIAPAYREAIKVENLAELPEELRPYNEDVHKLIQSIYDESILREMFENEHKSKIIDNNLNENFSKKEFQELWKHINHKYIYKVNFDSEELINHAVKALDSRLNVTKLIYQTNVGEQKDLMDESQLIVGDSFKRLKSRTEVLNNGINSNTKYDLIGSIAKGTLLTRKTIVKILKEINSATFSMFKDNPEDFISKTIRLIDEEKGALLVEKIKYNKIDDSYESDIFTAQEIPIDKAMSVNKHITPYLTCDSIGERKFTSDLEVKENEVCVYAKLPRAFKIPTPVGNYAPDWAIAFNEGSVKHIYFIAETKGSMSTMDLKKIELVKTNCAKELFARLSNGKVKYGIIKDYKDLMDLIN